MSKEPSAMKYALPMKEIKSDLMKTLIYVVFAVTFLLILHFGKVTFQDVVEVGKSVAKVFSGLAGKL